MKRFFLLAFWLFIAVSVKATPVTLTASDGVRVFAEEYLPEKPNGSLLLLFHQAGSNRGEYAPLAPRFAGMGYRCLAIDQRSGGARWGRPNETVLRLGRSSDYLSALADLQAALDWAIRQKPKHILVLGSSYSAALVFLLAAQNKGKVAAVLSFSPGEYLGAPNLVRQSAAKVNSAVFLDSASDSGELRATQTIYAALPSKQKTQFIPRHGIHGASTLRADQNPAGSLENWRAVSAFLKRYVQP